MDRALAYNDLADALGNHATASLPTVDELINLIADIEVRAFVGPDLIDDRLIQAAWYLHGIASAANAAELFTPIRQQRAFRVSAHVFDLALGSPNRSIHDRLTMAFAAQVGYRRSDLDPNATAIWRRVDAELEPLDQPASPLQDDLDADMRSHQDSLDAYRADLEDDPTFDGPGSAFSMMALRAGVAFLGFDIVRILQLLGQWQSEIERLRSAVSMDSLLSTMFGPAEQVVLAVSDLVQFLRYGLTSRLASARSALLSVVDLTAGQGDHDARWVAAHLLPIIDGLETSSVWTVLPQDSPDQLAQAFTIGAPSVLTLWPPQRDLLLRTSQNPLDATTKRLLLSVPTSAGKTLLAQILICHHLVTAPGDVCYVTPLRSLGREMRQALASRLRILRKGLGRDLPDFASMDLEDLLELLNTEGGGTIEVMTPERLAHMLRRDPASVLARFSMFVVDEAHLIAQAERGFLLESLLGFLATTDSRLVLLSGVMGNAQLVASWLDDSSADVLFRSDWRGPRRLHGILYSSIDWGTERIVTTRSSTYPIRKTYDVVGSLHIKPAEARTHFLQTDPSKPLGTKTLEYTSDGSEFRVGTQSTPFYKICARTARALLSAGSLLMIVSRRDYARGAAQTLADELPPSVKTEELVEFLIARIGAAHPLVECVRKGVAYHHAGLPVDVLDAIERAVRAEQLDALVATTTLTDGVNLPVRTVLISETRFPSQDPAQQLDPARLLNAVGRAGRAGRETEGWIILALQKRPNDADFNELRPADDDLEIRTTLMSQTAVEQLAQAEALLSESADAIFRLADSTTSDFASFVWFVLSAQQRLQGLPLSTNISAAVERMLAFQQLPSDLASRWLELAAKVAEAYDQTPEASRLRWTRAGTSLGSARKLESLATRVARRVIDDNPPLRIDGGDESGPMQEHAPGTGVSEIGLVAGLEALEAEGVFDSLLTLPERKKAWRFKATPGARTRVDVPIVPAVKLWMGGLDIATLADSMLPAIRDDGWRLEQTVDAVSGTFEHYLSWTLGVVVEQANSLLEEIDADVRLPPHLSSCIRYGVDTPQAVAMLAEGVRSRRLAYVVGRRAQEYGYRLTELVSWLRDLHIDGWVSEFGATDTEVEDLADLTREVSTSLISQLLSSAEATAELHKLMEPIPERPLPVDLRVVERHKPVEVWTVGEAAYQVGVVAASHHADVVALHAAGLTFSASTDGTFLTLLADR